MHPRICISGLSAVGKTSLAKNLSKIFEIKYIATSQILLDSAFISGYDSFIPEERCNHFWLSNKARKFNLQRIENPKLDKKIDLLMLSYINKERPIIIDSLSVPWLLNDGHSCITILLNARFNIRVMRAWLSGNRDINLLIKGIREKDSQTREILNNVWGFDIISKKYLNKFDLIVDNSCFDSINDIKKTETESKEKTFNIISTAILLYNQLRSRNLETKKYHKLLLKFRNLIKFYPDSIISVPDCFLHLSDQIKKIKWEERKHVWLKKSFYNQMGSW